MTNQWSSAGRRNGALCPPFRSHGASLAGQSLTRGTYLLPRAQGEACRQVKAHLPGPAHTRQTQHRYTVAVVRPSAHTRFIYLVACTLRGMHASERMAAIRFEQLTHDAVVLIAADPQRAVGRERQRRQPSKLAALPTARNRSQFSVASANPARPVMVNEPSVGTLRRQTSVSSKMSSPRKTRTAATTSRMRPLSPSRLHRRHRNQHRQQATRAGQHTRAPCTWLRAVCDGAPSFKHTMAPRSELPSLTAAQRCACRR
eukprot:COSAG01_NODE_11977_length_1824_cov_1.681159_2_plen_258_part_00